VALSGAPALWETDGGPVEVVREIGSSEQSTQWETSDRAMLVVLHPRDAGHAEQLVRRLGSVRRLDLTGLPLSRPYRLLRRPQIGYTTDPVTGLVPLGSLLSPAAAANFVVWYAATGGLQRRLRLLARVAEAITRLHDHGLAYGDPAPSNILVPAATTATAGQPAADEPVWLTDVHGVTLDAEMRVPPDVTVGYAAPDVVTGRHGVSSLSDAFAFAVLAFHVLAATHPFLGDAVYDHDRLLRDKGYTGRLPWVEHTTDGSNRCRYGVPRQWVLTPALRTLFEEAFEGGLWNPSARPTTGQWRDALFAAAGTTLVCERCRNGFYGAGATCPWCGDTAPPALRGRVRLDLCDDRGAALGRVTQPDDVTVQRDRVTPVAAGLVTFDDGDPMRPVAALRFERGGALTVHNRWNRPLWVVGPGGAPQLAVEPGADSAIPSAGDGRWELHFGPAMLTHRLIEFVSVAGAA
jgi:hypothetical protein